MHVIIVNGEITNMSKEEHRQTLMAMAEELVMSCDYCTCTEEDVDEDGNTYISYICPFLDSDNETCKIGDPSSWYL